MSIRLNFRIALLPFVSKKKLVSAQTDLVRPLAGRELIRGVT